MTAIDNAGLAALIALARLEDYGGGDVTTCLLADAGESASFRLLAKESGVFAGREIARAILDAYTPSIELEWSNAGSDGTTIENPPVVLATIRGQLGMMLAAERVLLNFLQRLSGVATTTRRFVDAVDGTGARVFDTRKTMPGWRSLDKYAVRLGGGCNHRKGLFDAVLIKDNHLAGVETHRLASVVFDMLNQLETGANRPSFVEVEAGDLAQVEELLKVVGIEVILLDNFSPDELRQAVALRDRQGLREKVALEASGGITLDTVRAVAQTGVERISVGAITHSAPALDLSLERI